MGSRGKSNNARKRSRGAESNDDDGSPLKVSRSESDMPHHKASENKENDDPATSSVRTNSTYDVSQRTVNTAGRPPEVGVIKKIHVENFMCHRKFTLELCRNVNFIHGQNGSGKSAILAAIQICLGAGARRTNRARNLKELVRKDASCTCAKVQVTLLNNGEDGYKQDVYGNEITVERTIAIRGGFNGYKLLDEGMKEQSRQKSDLDEMLDKLNIQVENPVAILDQEDAKKFLSCKKEDKYAFFLKATDLERMDRTYASCLDRVVEFRDQSHRMNQALEADLENVANTKKEWEKHQEMKKLKHKLESLYEDYSWATYKIAKEQHDKEVEHMQQFRFKADKKQLELSQAEEALTAPDDEEDSKKAKMDELIQEAGEQATMKRDLEAELKRASEPQKARERELRRTQKQLESEAKNLERARAQLKQKREEILAQAGSAESEEARRTEQLKMTEEELTVARQKHAELKQAVSNAYRAYEELEPHLDQAKQNCGTATAKLNATEARIRSLQSSSSDNLAMFGTRCAKVKQLVNQWQRQKRFKGPVVGPIGSFVKIAAGKERFASIAENALGYGTLDRFIVTNDYDRKTFQQLRREAGCSQDCGVFQVHSSPRYTVPDPPVEGIETVASVLNFTDDLVFNCLVDTSRIDERALSASKEESERLLLVKNPNNSFSIRGKIKEVFVLPNGDHWSVRDGSIAMVGNEKKLRQTIGVDKSAALAEAKKEAETIRHDLKDLRQEEAKLEHNHTDYQREWNVKKRAHQKCSSEIDKIISKIDQIKAEQDSAANFDTDTSEFEQEVTECEQALANLEEQESQFKEEIEEHKPAISAIRTRLDEVKNRNEKVMQDMTKIEQEMARLLQNKTQREEKLTRKREKIKQYQSIIAQQEEKLSGISRDVEKNLRRAKKLSYLGIRRREAAEDREGEPAGSSQVSELTPEEMEEPTDEELEKIEVNTDVNDPKWYESRIMRAKKKIEQERQRREVSNDDPAVAYQKYIRAKQTLDSKVEQIKQIEDTTDQLTTDMRERKRRWRRFRDLIERNTDQKFDEILNLRGSSGNLEFNHKTEELGLVVQKDSADANSQQKDVNALSGGERSFTTIALLLALGETLETPFRILDEFDVFLDPMSRKLVLETLIEVGLSMEHRQFIFITPQDLSNIDPNEKLKILKLKPPERSGIVGLSQQTLEFSQR